MYLCSLLRSLLARNLPSGKPVVRFQLATILLASPSQLYYKMSSLVVDGPVQISKDMYHYVPGRDLNGSPSIMDEMFISGKQPSTSQSQHSSNLALDFDLKYYTYWFKESKYGMTRGAVPFDSDLQWSIFD